MRKVKLLATAALAMVLAACSSDTTEPNGDSNNNAFVSYAPARAAEVAAYSNGNRVSGPKASVVSVSAVSPLADDVLQSTAKVFLEVLPEEQDNLNLSPTKPGVSNWSTNYLYVSDGKPFTLYPAYSKTSKQDNTIGVFYYDEEGNKHEQDIFFAQYCPWGYYKNQRGIKITIAKGYKFGFYLNNYYGYNRQDRFGNYVGEVSETFYSNVSENAASCSHDAHYKLWEDQECHGKGVHSASFNYGGNTFFGFEDWEHYNYNFDLNDIVFMVSPALDVKDNPKEEDKKPEVKPVDPTPEPTPDPVDPTPNPSLPDPAPEVVAGNGSVEVNFSINERQYESNDTKLSIHVRDTTDVTLFVPTPAEYYCPVDDMLIVQKHDVAMAYSPSSTVDMNINGNIVRLTTTYSQTGITISTNGINAAVLKYLRNTYNDGLTFEITSYFNTKRVDANGNMVAVTRDGLQAMLNRTTISFTRTPAFYLNAFGVLKDTQTVNPNDCFVTPANTALFGDRKEDAPEHGSTSHLYIWERK